MVELKGSERQVRWAEDVRRKALEHAQGVLTRFEQGGPGGYPKADPEAAEQTRAHLAFLEAQEDARWWIDRRNQNFLTVARLELRLELRK
jgi:hypothetical protein